MRKNGIEWNEPQSRAALYTPAALRRRWRRRELFGKLRGMFTLENGGKYGESVLNFYKIVYIYALSGWSAPFGRRRSSFSTGTALSGATAASARPSISCTVRAGS